MAKKRKKRVPLGEVVKDVEVKEAAPKCYGAKEEFCNQELCGQWFESCGVEVQYNIHRR